MPLVLDAGVLDPLGEPDRRYVPRFRFHLFLHAVGVGGRDCPSLTVSARRYLHSIARARLGTPPATSASPRKYALSWAFTGAGDGNRTRIASLEGWNSDH